MPAVAKQLTRDSMTDPRQSIRISILTGNLLGNKIASTDTGVDDDCNAESLNDDADDVPRRRLRETSFFPKAALLRDRDRDKLFAASPRHIANRNIIKYTKHILVMFTVRPCEIVQSNTIRWSKRYG